MTVNLARGYTLHVVYCLIQEIIVTHFLHIASICPSLSFSAIFLACTLSLILASNATVTLSDNLCIYHDGGWD